ncbi:hypothetical protein EDC90_103350 [Martelella mediterranea]|uniref:Uncharacterized protein n=1 Tax=Martelella mediterranea TaxID=293089 RepID=A0A4R3NR46_9HYPH|nr:hypothetical protein EDC90_103350 [Martelella mediterranea]
MLLEKAKAGKLTLKGNLKKRQECLTSRQMLVQAKDGLTIGGDQGRRAKAMTYAHDLYNFKEVQISCRTIPRPNRITFLSTSLLF